MSKASPSLYAAKKAVHAAMEQGLLYETALCQGFLGTESVREGFNAFVRKESLTFVIFDNYGMHDVTV